MALPTADQLRAEVRAMVDLGPRLTGSPAHQRFCTWLAGALRDAGLTLLPADEYPYRRWTAHHASLVLAHTPGAAGTAVAVAAPYVRAAPTPAGGVTGPLVHLGTLPLPDPAAGIDEPEATRPRPPAQQAWLDRWRTEDLTGAIAVVDLPIPLPLDGSLFAQAAEYVHWPGHRIDELAAVPYRRPWIGPWPALDLLADLGVVGVVLALDAPAAMVAGNYSPHVGRPQPLPAVVVDRDSGRMLRQAADRRPTARLVLDATVEDTTVRSITAVLPGDSDEVLVVNSHSDGQNAFEENGAVALVALARHFADRPPGQRLRRTLAVACWPAHMGGVVGIEDASCWITAHGDLCARAAAAVTIEHIGATEWVETADGALVATGEPELYAVWATMGAAAEVARAAVTAADLHRHAILRPPVQITPGARFHDAGVPHVSGIAGPPYLLVVSDDGEMARLDAELAARQVACFADVLERLDRIDAAMLRATDPTLGSKPPACPVASRSVDPLSPPPPPRTVLP